MFVIRRTSNDLHYHLLYGSVEIDAAGSVMAARTVEHPPTCDMTVVDVFAALGDPTRIAIVRTLCAAGGEMAWSSFDLPIARSTLSHHLKVLRTAGIVKCRQDGTRSFVSLRLDDLERRFPGLVQIVLNDVEVEVLIHE
jgi:DNA-binding transcriptional ArsR family regulator